MERILLVEDNEHIMDINEWFLKERGYEIDKAYTLKEAEQCIKKHVPDVIVLDIMLPDGDGVDFCEKLQKDKPVPVLFLTAKTDKKDVMEGYSRGGNDYLTKPYELEMLGVRVEALLRLAERTGPGGVANGQAAKNITLRAGSLTFEPVSSTLKVGDEKLTLSTKEFGILYCLAKNRGRQVSKDTLFREVWEMEPDGDTSVLWSTIYRLKKKIAPYEDKFYIDSDHSGYEIIIVDR